MLYMYQILGVISLRNQGLKLEVIGVIGYGLMLHNYGKEGLYGLGVIGYINGYEG